MIRRDVVTVVLAEICLAIILFAVIPTRSMVAANQLEYDSWADLNGDGKVDILDVVLVASKYGSAGTPQLKAGLEYDSGWIDITEKAGQYVTIVHDLNLNLSSTDVVIEIVGKTTMSDNTLLRQLGLMSQTSWDKTYGGALYDEAHSVIKTVDGGFLIAGETMSFGVGEYDFWLIKTDADGNVAWNKTYGGIGVERAYSVIQTNDGGYAVTGWTDSIGAGYHDFWLLKTDSAGNAQWSRTYGGADDDVAFSVVQLGDGGYAVAGWTNSSGAGSYDFWLVKTDASGTAQWNRTYGGTEDEVADSLISTSDGGYMIAGWTSSYGVGYHDFWLVKTDVVGNIEWNKTYGGIYDEVAHSVIQTSDEGYAITGWTNSFGAGSYDAWLVKTDATGNLQWNKTYGGVNYDDAWSIVRADDGGYAIAGSTEPYGAGNLDFWLVKTDVNGNLQWTKDSGGPRNDYGVCVALASDGEYVVAGWTRSFGAGNDDVWVVKSGLETSLTWTDSTPNTITLYRGATDSAWNFVRVYVWRAK